MQGDHVYADKQLVIARTTLPGLLSIMGAIDYFNAAAVATALKPELLSAADRAAERGDLENADGRLRIDLSRLEFVDTCGIRALVTLATDTGERGGLVLLGLPPLIRRVMELVGWGELPGLVIDEDRQAASSQ
jgi:anti-anti-sigma regulatory factor